MVEKRVRYALAVDLGGTNLRAGVVAADGALVRHRRTSTPGDGSPDAVVDAISTLASEIVAQSAGDNRGVNLRLAAVGVAAPGPLDPETGIVYETPNLAGWEDFPLARRLAKALRLPVWVHNDANLAALGESICGAARGFDPSIYLTVSTGVGGGIIQHGRIYGGAHGLAGELGHVIVRAGGPTCNFGHPGCLEALASGTAIARRARECLAAGVQSTIPNHVGTAGGVTSVAVARAAASGDQLALELFHEAGEALGYGIGSFINAYDVARVVIGGGVSQSWDLFAEPMWRAVRSVTMVWRARAVDIVPAELGDNGGLVGAGLYALSSAG